MCSCFGSTRRPHQGLVALGVFLVCWLALAGCADEFLAIDPAADAASGGSTATTTSSTTTIGTGGGQTGGAGPGGTAGSGATGADTPCHPPGLTDGFGGSDLGPLWETWGAHVASGVSAGLAYAQPQPQQPDDSWGGIRTVQTYDFRSCSVWIELVQALAGPSAGVFVRLWRDPNNFVQFFVVDEDITISGVGEGQSLGQAKIEYLPQQHRWLRVREQAGTTYLESSPDAYAWTATVSFPTPLFLADTQLRFGAGTTEAVTSPGHAKFDNVNMLP